MRFLVIAKGKHVVPPEMVLSLIEAMEPWQRKYATKMETFGLAGIIGGGGIANVESLEELDQLMSEFPFLPFSDVEVYPLVDLEGALQRAKQSIQAMMPQR